MEEKVSLDEVRNYVKNLRILGNPTFCEKCLVIRADRNPTFLNDWEQMLYNNRGMCTKCFEYINNLENDKQELKDRMEIWENELNFRINQ